MTQEYLIKAWDPVVQDVCLKQGGERLGTINVDCLMNEKTEKC